VYTLEPKDYNCIVLNSWRKRHLPFRSQAFFQRFIAIVTDKVLLPYLCLLFQLLTEIWVCVRVFYDIPYLSKALGKVFLPLLYFCRLFSLIYFTGIAIVNNKP